MEGLQYGLKASALDVLNSVALYNQIRREAAPFFEEHDVLMTPTMPTPLVEIDFYNADDKSIDARGWVDKLFNGWAHFTGVVNVTGQPAISLPLQQASDGLPIESLSPREPIFKRCTPRSLRPPN